jgi:class 3 adenylate cyclase/tetratricopeptide (TPR) repeat protein
VPNALIPPCLREILEAGAVVAPWSRTEPMAVLFTDVVSFTRITEKVSRRGHYGVEAITGVLNRYFDEMNTEIEAHGGSLMKYGGDSLLAVFPGEETPAMERLGQCLAGMRVRLVELNRIFLQRHEIEVDFKHNGAWGDVTLNIVGDPVRHLDYYMSGPAIEAVFGFADPVPEPEGSPSAPPCGEPMSGDRFIPATALLQLNSSMFRAELRPVAVIFVNLAPADNGVRIALKDYQDYYCELQRIVGSHEGLVNKIDFTDKGYMILITFGLPRSRPDDILRAFTACHKIRAIPAPHIQSRLGLAYGLTYAGIIGAQHRYEYGIIGNEVNISARLMGTARYGDIHVAEEILPLIAARFETALVGDIAVKGIETPIKVYRVVREIPNLWEGYRKLYDDQPLIGSTSVLDTASRLFPEGGLMIVRGGSGSGKSFMLEKVIRTLGAGKRFELLAADEFNLRRAHHFLDRILENQMLLTGLAQPPDLLFRYCEARQIDIDPNPFADFCTGRRELDTQELDILTANLAEIFACHFKLYDLLVIDNYHWIDPFSRRILDSLIPRLVDHGTLVVITSPVDCPLPGIDELAGGIIELTPFEPDETTSFLTASRPNLTPAVIAEIHTLTRGNPRFLSELRRRLDDVLPDREAVIDLSDYSGMIRSGAIASTIESTIFQQYENLEPNEKSILKYASIIGSHFTAASFSLTVGPEMLEQARRILLDLHGKQLLTVNELMPEIEYLFQNGVLRERIYQTVPKGEKIEIHNRLGEFYETQFDDHGDAYHEIIAHHYLMAENAPKALHYAVLAAHKAAAAYAFADSNYFLEQVLPFADPPTQAHLKLRVVENALCLNQIDHAEHLLAGIDADRLTDPVDRSRRHFCRIRILELQRNYPELIDYIAAELDDIRDPGYRAKARIVRIDCLRILNRREEFEAAGAALDGELLAGGDAMLRVRLLAIIAEDAVNTGRYDLAERIYHDMLAAAEQAGELPYKQIALNCLGNVSGWNGDQDKARAYYEQSLTIAGKIGDKLGYARVLSSIAVIHRMHDQPEQALDLYERALKTARRVGDLLLINVILYQIGELHASLGEFDAAYSFYSDSLAIAQRINDAPGISYARDAIADCHFQLGRTELALEIYNQNLEFQQRISDREGVGHTLGNLGNIAKESGQYDLARDYYTRQMTLLLEIGDKLGAGNAFFNLGGLDCLLENYQPALASVTRAHDLYRECELEDRARIAAEWMEKINAELRGESPDA